MLEPIDESALANMLSGMDQISMINRDVWAKMVRNFEVALQEAGCGRDVVIACTAIQFEVMYDHVTNDT